MNIFQANINAFAPWQETDVLKIKKVVEVYYPLGKKKHKSELAATRHLAKILLLQELKPRIQFFIDTLGYTEEQAKNIAFNERYGEGYTRPTLANRTTSPSPFFKAVVAKTHELREIQKNVEKARNQIKVAMGGRKLKEPKRATPVNR